MSAAASAPAGLSWTPTGTLCTITTAAGDVSVKADVVAIDAPRAPSYALLEQAGAALTHEPRGFVARTERGKIRDGFFAIGECLGAPVAASTRKRLASRFLVPQGENSHFRDFIRMRAHDAA